MSAQLVSTAEQLPYLVRAIRALARRPHYDEEADELLHDLSAITVMVATKFTNNRTAEGLLEAQKLTVGCISLALAHAHLGGDDEVAIDLLVSQGAERVFQHGFRLIKDLAALPEIAMISVYDQATQEQERHLKSAFLRFCLADPNDYWTGYQSYKRELENRTKVSITIDCAKWLRKHHHAGAVREADMDAEGVLAIALIFAIRGDGKIYAKAGQKDMEILIAALHKTKPDVEAGWMTLLEKVPDKFQALLATHIEHIRTSAIISQILVAGNMAKPGKATVTKLFQALQNHGGNEVEVDYM